MDFVEVVERILHETHFDPSRLELELTESVLLGNVDTAEAAMLRLKALGVRLALDDFGTGYSSLLYLRRFPFDKLKIDRSFVRSIEKAADAAAIVHAIVSLGRGLGMQGHRRRRGDRRSAALSTRRRRPFHAGYRFGRPVTVAEISARLQSPALPAHRSRHSQAKQSRHSLHAGATMARGRFYDMRASKGMTRKGHPMAASAKIALVTGAGTGVGRAVAIALAKAGYNIVLAGRRKEMLDKVAGEINVAGAQALAVPTDVSNASSILALFATVKATFGRLDVLFNNAGIGAPPVPLEELPVEKWQERGRHQPHRLFLCTQEAIKIMKDQYPRGGRIINNGSISAHTPRPVFGRLYLDQARRDRAHQIDFARRPRLRHRLRAGRHRQRRDADDRPHGAGGVLQADGRMMIEPRMDAEHVGNAVVYMASLPLDANVLFMTVMATKMPFVGRG